MEKYTFYIKLVGLLGIGVGLAGSGCGTSSLKVQTVPEGAQIDLLHEDGSATKLGNSPLSLTKEQSPEVFRANNEIRVSKDGYQSSSVLVPYSSLGEETRVNVSLQEAKLPSSCSNQDANLNEVGQKIAEAQRLIYKKDYVESRRILQGLSGMFPSVAIIYSLLGNGFYLEKNYPEALAAYRHALSLTPNDKSITHIIEKLMPVTGEDKNGFQGGAHQ
jgi:tetratricopeptide (TPR) repeat protein